MAASSRRVSSSSSRTRFAGPSTSWTVNFIEVLIRLSGNWARGFPMLRLRRVDALVCCLWLMSCAGGSANQRPSASVADARLADNAEANAPEASVLVKQGETKLGQNDASGAKQLFEQALAQNASDS